ncbi:transporter substrate-binding domain-containing protein [Sphingomonas sp. A2-49]|uniref:substrate-binding periplasmic protein n=1 Tax=Sphingomonas sp. A2-49 TaxID=1391375 RepID=UPI0021D060C4|nr:transporter substrate-binding domain-containing protein [Sphingomonas sp. A2-49]MCU6454558.1 transporter substrate-binding domain-containing protein [Sphingomonas sp. A2-49]
MIGRRAFLAGGVAAALLPRGAAAASLDKLKAAGVLRVAVYRDFAPWSWRRDGTLVGIDVDFAQALAASLGLRAEMVDFMADEDVGDDLRNMIWRGPLIGGSVADVMMHVPYDRTFALANDRAVFVAPYYREGFQMACGIDTDCEVAPPQLKGKRLVAELDSIPDFYLSGSFGGVLRGDVQHLPSGDAALTAVKEGRADAVLATRAQVEHALAGGNPKVKVRRGPLPALPSPGWDVGLAVKDDSRDLGDALERSVAALQKDGTLARILVRYGVSPKAPLAAA